MAEVSVEDLKAEITSYNFSMITGGDDDVAKRALVKATMWAKAKVLHVAGVFDPSSEINREIVIKRALYELYSYAENEAVARDKKDDAFELLRAAYGSGVDGTNQDNGSAGESEGTPVAAIKPGERDTSLF